MRLPLPVESTKTFTSTGNDHQYIGDHESVVGIPGVEPGINTPTGAVVNVAFATPFNSTPMKSKLPKHAVAERRRHPPACTRRQEPGDRRMISLVL